jgi:multidrug transporter EmrE-like cation transporter
MIQNYLLLTAAILTASAAQILFKKGTLDLGRLDFSLAGILDLIPKIFQNVWLVIGMASFFISFLLYLFVLSKAQLITTYPIVVGSGIILVTLASWLIFKESISLWQFIGISAIILGIFLVIPKS